MTERTNKGKKVRAHIKKNREPRLVQAIPQLASNQLEAMNHVLSDARLWFAMLSYVELSSGVPFYA